MSEGCFLYYFLEVPLSHPYPVEKVLSSAGYKPPKGLTEITSLNQARWGLRRFIYDAMLYWGNFRQAYRDLRLLSFEAIAGFFAAKKINGKRITTRGKVTEPTPIPEDSRYLISEMACKTYEARGRFQYADHVRLAIEGYRALRAEGAEVTPELLRARTGGGRRGQKSAAAFRPDVRGGSSSSTE